MSAPYTIQIFVLISTAAEKAIHELLNPIESAIKENTMCWDFNGKPIN